MTMISGGKIQPDHNSILALTLHALAEIFAIAVIASLAIGLVVAPTIYLAIR
ncbi:hypothetical protein [Agrobacterium cavarae]|uniref:hypothetical protein n=1 Tax=Agrobacterium cavarae TaxID=2528239 RepID=UPI0013EF3FC5|nr:hypothetical protein [Agrobacterium cavarae]